ncbi:hypothetical protein JYB64_01000 [Algoriphagus aestuarii]|nr:hypothetical protein [Algoriphagus aestuarii]
MRRFISFFAICILAFSCTSTQVFTRFKCHICLSKSEGVLLLPLGWDSGFSRLSPGEQNQLESQILTLLRDQGFTKVELYDRMDYELLSSGIKDLNDPAQRAKVNSDLGYPYFLGITLGETVDSEGWDYRTAKEVYEMNPPTPDQDISATLRVALIETASGNIVSDNAIVTEINAWGIPDKDGGENYWNFGSVSQAIRKATSKGVGFMVKDCAC